MDRRRRTSGRRQHWRKPASGRPGRAESRCAAASRARSPRTLRCRASAPGPARAAWRHRRRSAIHTARPRYPRSIATDPAGLRPPPERQAASVSRHAEMLRQAFHESLATGELLETHPFVRLMRLLDVTRAADHRGLACGLRGRDGCDPIQRGHRVRARPDPALHRRCCVEPSLALTARAKLVELDIRVGVDRLHRRQQRIRIPLPSVEGASDRRTADAGSRIERAVARL